MSDYILNSGLCLAFFFGFYKLILEKDTNHFLKRFYLLGIILLSFGIPLVTFTTYIEVVPQETITFTEEFTTFESPTTIDIISHAVETNYTPIILWSIYFLGVLIFSIQFIYNLTRIYLRIKSNPKQQNHSFTHVLLQELVAPHTFFNYIFFNKTKFESDEIPQEVHLHEQAHASQKHSLDILFIEVLKVIFWFNPLIYFIRHSIKLNHEFLADQAVLNNGITTSSYQQILLSFTENKMHTPLANAINYSSIKKRFTVMKTPTSKNKLWVKSILILPLIAMLLFAFSQKETVEKEVPQIQTQKDTTTIQTAKNDGVSKELMKEYDDFMKIYKSRNMIMMDQYNRIVPIYELMSNVQRNSVEKYPTTPFYDGSKTKPKKPTIEQYESWKDQEKFALWLDGKVIKNTELSNHKVSDIYHFFGSGVSNNARSERFPQPYQFNLYTEKHYENTIVKSNLNNYNRLIKSYDEKLRFFLKSDRSDNTELKILKIRIDKLYNNFSEKDLKEWDVKIAPPVPSTKKSSQQKQPQPAPKKAEPTILNQDSIDLKQFTYQLGKGEIMSSETKTIHDKYESFLKGNPNYVSWMQIDLEADIVTYSVHSAMEKAPNNLRKTTVGFENSSYVCYMDFGKPYDRAKDEQTALKQNKKIEILINKNGDYLIDGEYSYLDKITEKIKGFSLEERKELIVNVISDPNTPVKWVEYLKTMLRKNDVSKVNFEIRNTISKESKIQKTSQQELDPDGDIPFANLDVFPVYPGCSGTSEEIKACFHKSMQIHISRKFNLDLAGNLELSPGTKKIYSVLKITKTGKIEVIKSRSSHEALDEEMKRVVKLYPKVTPGKYKGEFVDTSYMIPVTFNIE